MTAADTLSPRLDCPLLEGCGYGFCRACDWGELPGMSHECGAARAMADEEERCDREALAAIEGALGAGFSTDAGGRDGKAHR